MERRLRFSPFGPGGPELGVEGALDGFRVIAGALRGGPDRVFHLERESRGERAEPPADVGERGSPVALRAVRLEVAHPIERAPRNAALGVTNELTETVNAVRPDVLVRVLRVAELGWVDDPKRRGVVEPARLIDRSRECVASRLVVVQGERDRLDAVLGEANELLGLDPGAADRGDVRDPLRAEVVNVDEAFDEDELAPLARREAEDVRQPVRREIRASRAPQVEVARLAIVKRSRPERPDPPPLVSPRAAQPPGPAVVRDDAGSLDLFHSITAVRENALCRLGRRDESESRTADRLGVEAAPLEIRARPRALRSGELPAGELEEA